jgi:AcrR family transcriptional regulator
MARSQPRSVEERRRQIIAATVPLLQSEGFAVSTKRIADAAGVAEGTLFRVFATKEDLMRAALGTVMDTSDLVSRIDSLDADLALAGKLSAVMAIVQESATRVHTLMLAMRAHRLQAIKAAAETGQSAPPRWPGGHGSDQVEGRVRAGAPRDTGDTPPGVPPTAACPGAPVPALLTDGHGPHHWPGHQQMAAQAQALQAAIERALAPNQADLVVDLPTAATYLVATALASLFAAMTLPPSSAESFVTLTLRALTDRRDS